VLELALREMKVDNVWAILRDYSEINPHSDRTAEFKTKIAILAEQNMFTSIAGKNIEF